MEKFNVQITGLTSGVAENLGIAKHIEIALEKISKVTEIGELHLHVKAFDVDGERKRFSFNCRLFTQISEFSIEREGWSALTLIEEIMDDIERMVLKKKSQQRTEIMKKLERDKV